MSQPWNTTQEVTLFLTTLQVKELINEEEQQFLLTLRRGQRLLQREVERLKKSQATTLPGAVAWRLYDTYGFPLDLIQIMTSEVGIEV